MGQRVILFSDRNESQELCPTLHSRLLFFVDDAIPIRDEIKSFGKFAILYSYKFPVSLD